MKIQRLLVSLEIAVRGHLLNPFWKDKSSRWRKKKEVQTQILTRYLKRYLYAAEAVKEKEVVNNDAEDRIFTLWLQGEENAPELVKACIRSMRHHCTQQLVVLDEKTLFEYIDLPTEIVEKYKAGKIRRAHFADICRVELLYRYGGYWFDATLFVTSPIPDEIKEQDFFVYLTNPENFNIGGPYCMMQNYFIRARKGSFLLEAWRAMILAYWMNEDKKIHYFMHQLLFKVLVTNNDKAAKYFDAMVHHIQDPTHKVWWGYGDKPYDEQKFKELTSQAFFQKTTNNHKPEDIVKGSFIDEMINRMYISK